MYTKYAFVEFKNCGTFVYKIKSENPIDIDVVANFFKENEDWSQERDSITLMDEILTVKI